MIRKKNTELQGFLHSFRELCLKSLGNIQLCVAALLDTDGFSHSQRFKSGQSESVNASHFPFLTLHRSPWKHYSSITIPFRWNASFLIFIFLRIHWLHQSLCSNGPSWNKEPGKCLKHKLQCTIYDDALLLTACGLLPLAPRPTS